MKYCIVYQEGEQVTETYSEVEADSPQGAGSGGMRGAGRLLAVRG